MNSFSDYISHGHAWLFIPSAVLLGALHGLEPGHSKTMMAAFIISIRGTVRQAALLGLAATVSHTAVVWALAFVGLHYAGRFNVEETEPYFQLATGLIVIAMAGWLYWRIRRERAGSTHAHGHEHGPHGGTLLDTADGGVEISVFEDGVPPRFRLHFRDTPGQLAAMASASGVSLITTRPGDMEQTFHFAAKDGFLESTTEIPEPHEFQIELVLPHEGATRSYRTEFVEGHDHHHGHGGGEAEPDDAHARAHAAELEHRFANRQVTTWQIVLFGLTGGLLPCPSAFAVLLVCLQLKKFSLGFALVLAFSVGLALTLVGVGTLAALSVRHATRRLVWLGPLTQKLPYASCILLALIGLGVAVQGLRHLPH